MDSSTTDILVEVTSRESLAAAKLVMEALLEGMVACQCAGMELCVEQVKVMEAEQLLVLYPSRADLTSDSLDVRRP